MSAILKPFAGTLTISRTVSNSCDDYISIQIRDDRGTLIRARMEMVDFAQCVTGLAAQPMAGEIRDDAP